MSPKPSVRARLAPARPKRAIAAHLVRSAPGAARSKDDADSRFDRLVYERVRLGIMSALAVPDELTFNELKGLFEVSDGNLSAHARKLEEAATWPVRSPSTGAGRNPNTASRQPAARRLHRYLEHIEAVIKATRAG